MAKAIKVSEVKLSDLQVNLVKGLNDLIKQIKTQEPAPAYEVPAFDPKAETALQYAQRITAEAKEHGDTEQANARLFSNLIGESIRAMLEENGLNVRSTGTRKERVVLTAAQMEEIKTIRAAYLSEKKKPESERDQKVIMAGQIGQLASKYDVSVTKIYSLTA